MRSSGIRPRMAALDVLACLPLTTHGRVAARSRLPVLYLCLRKQSSFEAGQGPAPGARPRRPRFGRTAGSRPAGKAAPGPCGPGLA
ncbi:hypothetical protein EYE35_13600 [Cereibacter sphaeroides]|nr:hypothetical protein EYE35_13600 [Cereibacter sphaeroides]